MIIKRIIIILFVLLLLIGISACSSDGETMGVATDWADFVRWDGQSYENNSQIVPVDLVGERIGSVQLKAPTNVPNYEPKDGTAGQLETGTEFFQIRGYSQSSYIAVFTSDEYILYKTHESESISLTKDEGNQVSSQISENDNATQADAYFLIFQNLYESDSALNSDIKYIAVDLSEMQFETPDAFTRLMDDFCTTSGFTLLLDNVDGLAEKGYIKESYFEEGILISFRDTELTDNKLITEAMKWRSGLGAIGATFTVEKMNDTWEITETENDWIS